MKKIIYAAFALLCLGVAPAKAQQMPGYTVGYSSYASVGYRCSTGTISALPLNNTRPVGFSANVMGYRIFTANPNNVFIGGPAVSTSTTLGDSIANLGIRLVTNTAQLFQVGKAYGTGGVPLVPLFCKAEDSAGNNGVVISVEWFGN